MAGHGRTSPVIRTCAARAGTPVRSTARRPCSVGFPTARSGIWRPRVLLDDHDGGTAGDAAVTRHTVTLDPDFHAVPEDPGRLVLRGRDGLPATALRIDTTKLANGAHKLHLRSDCDDPTKGSINSGVLVIPFTVSNG
jgi:hypothetical protein